MDTNTNDLLLIANIASVTGREDDMPPKITPDCLLSFAEVAEIIGLDESSLRNSVCGTDELLRIKAGSRTLFSFNDVQDWIARRVAQARADRQQKAERLAQRKAEALRRKRFVKDTVLTLIK